MFVNGEFLKRSAIGALLFGATTFLETQDAHAASSLPAGKALELGSRSLQPIGHYEFCKEHASECDSRYKEVPRAELTPSLWQFILKTDSRFNRAITAISDLDHWMKEEVWSYVDDNLGDCEDYVLEKRRALKKKIHPSNLLITVVQKPDGEGHAVLTVRTDRGDIFLDNLEKPMFVEKSPYKIFKTVDPHHEGKWVSVRGKTDAPLAGSNKTAATQALQPGLF